MWLIILIMSVVLVVAVLTLTYAAFPHRGRAVPGMPWLGAALERAARVVPTFQDGDRDHDHDHDPTSSDHDAEDAPSRH